jgi:hypothetical protein
MPLEMRMLMMSRNRTERYGPRTSAYNLRDRRFNNLKIFYHTSQVFSLDDAVESLRKSKYVIGWKDNALGNRCSSDTEVFVKVMLKFEWDTL